MTSRTATRSCPQKALLVASRLSVEQTFMRHVISHACCMQVAAFQCLQPFVGAVLAFAVLGEEPSIWDVGAIGVILGLVLVAKDPTETTAMFSKIKRIVSQTSLAKG